MNTAAADVMLVEVGGSSYALPVSALREIVRLPPLTRVPGLPEFVAGLANVRGRVLAVIDLRPLLGLEAARGDRLVILDGTGNGTGNGGASFGNGNRAIVGIVVDAARDLVQLPEGALEPLPPGVPTEASEVLDGITVIDGTPVAVLSPVGLLGLRRHLSSAA